MSPNTGTPAAAPTGFPRVSGDEPVRCYPAGWPAVFSPRERG